MDGTTAWLVLMKLASWLAFPLSLAGLAMLAVLVWPGVPRGPRALCAVALVVLWGGGSPFVARTLTGPLEARATPAPGAPSDADAIVLLGGGVVPALPPRREPEVNEAGDRVLEAARLFRAGRAPRVVSCGGSLDGLPPEAAGQAALLRFLGVPAEAILEESRSRTTRENALAAKALLEPLGARRILLVTSALHMPRAVALFEGVGFEVVPAPTDWLTAGEGPATRAGRVLWLFPTAEALAVTTRAVREWLGLAASRAFGWAG